MTAYRTKQQQKIDKRKDDFHSNMQTRDIEDLLFLKSIIFNDETIFSD